MVRWEKDLDTANPPRKKRIKNYHYKGYGRLCECSIHFIVIDASYVVASDLVQTPIG